MNSKVIFVLLLVGLVFCIGSVSAIDKNEYKVVDYKDLDANENDYMLDKMVFNGIVYDSFEKEGCTWIVIEVGGDVHKSLSVMKEGSFDVKKDDNITVYGYGFGKVSDGPLISADEIVIEN